MKRTFVADLMLAARFFRDLSKLYLLLNNNEIAYYNLLFALACGTQPKTILELGTGPGVSSLAFLRTLQYTQAATGQMAHLHTCDINAKTIKRLLKYQPMVVPHVMPSDELAVEWRANPQPIDVLFIDALHTSRQALVDFDNFAPFVIPNGLILMHDTHPLTPEHEQVRYSGDVYKAAIHIKTNYAKEYEYTTYPHLCGIGVIRKRGGQILLMEIAEGFESKTTCK